MFESSATSFTAVFSYSSEKEFLDIIEQCIGHIGHALGRDSQRSDKLKFDTESP